MVIKQNDDKSFIIYLPNKGQWDDKNAESIILAFSKKGKP
jgi:hypothetical protein